ncbi:MAG: aldo/keto reductase [Actinobacteria bacterium]|nr:aldo/keto reductase [Actinomycetota bacterium]
MPRIALGCYPLGGGYGGLNEKDARYTVDAALDSGWRFLDTAETYLDSEERLGRILQGRRDEIFLATKAFPCETYSYEHLSAALDGSLTRLQTDWVDLYQLHGPEDWVATFGEKTALDELGDSLTRLRHSGRTLNVGVCNLDAETLVSLSRRAQLFSTQNLYSLLDRGEEDDPAHLPVETEIIPTAKKLGIAFLAFSPLSRGLLADNLERGRTFRDDDERSSLPRFQPAVYPHYVEVAHSLQAWAADHGRSLVQLAVAWTLANPGVTSTLVGAKSAAQVRAISGAESWLLSASDLAEIDGILSTLHPDAQAAKMIVWDHFRPEFFSRLRDRRYASAGGRQ